MGGLPWQYQKELDTYDSAPLREPGPVVKAKKWPADREGFTCFLVAHGCVIEDCEKYFAVTYPAGTVRYEQLPRIGSEVIRVVLPDGIELQQINLSYRLSVMDDWESTVTAYEKDIKEFNDEESRGQTTDLPGN